MELTHFQDIVAMALDLSDIQAEQLPRGWPETEDKLRHSLRQWKRIMDFEIKGHELLAICGEIWKYHPVDQGVSEGREILYHPLDGTAIKKGSPMDGIPIETLAFLRWLLDNRFFVWTDEVAIVREVKAVNSIIEDLPDDRFYGKKSLPYTSHGTIDWSDLSLAQAKYFVANGTVRPDSSPPAPRGFYFDENTLEVFLASITPLNDETNRTGLLKNLPPGPCGLISRSSAPATDIANIVYAVEGMGRLSNREWAINILIDNVSRFVRGTQKAGELEAFKK